MAAKKHKRVSTKYIADMLDEFEPGSRKKVLKNLLGITTLKEMQKVESQAYLETEKAMIGKFTKDQKLRLADVHWLHRTFMGKIYSWAGSTRSFNISKGGFIFATAYALPSVLEKFESEALHKNTPCTGNNIVDIAEKIAVVHAEFLVLHPYREGNGRTARLIATLMAYQAGLPGIDFGFIGSRGKEFEKYIAAIQEALRSNYAPMVQIVLRALRLALASSGSAA